MIKKISKRLLDIQKAAISAEIPEQSAAPRIVADGAGTSWKPMETSLADELAEAGDDATRALREKQREMIDSLDLSK